MANYLYNGVELPDINEVWTDKSTYPYATIADVNVDCPGAYAVRFSTENAHVFTSEGELSHNYPVGTKYITYVYCPEETGVDGWVYDGEDETNENSSSLSISEYPFIWTSVNIINNTDGSVYLAASNPVLVGSTTFPVPEAYRPYVNFAKKVYEQAYGLDVDYGKLAVAENEQFIAVHFLTDDFRLVSYDADTTEYTATGISFVAYDKKNDVYDSTPTDNRTTTSEAGRFISNWVWSEVDVTWNGATVFTNQEGWYYNSVKLLELPVVDGKPYMAVGITGGAYMLICANGKVKYDAVNNTVIAGEAMSYTAYILNGAEWGNSWSGECPANHVIITEISDTSKFIWSNYDINSSDSSLYLSASEPVHVTYVVDDEDDEGNGKGLFDFSGAIAPELPAYDSTMYPCATILGDGTYNDQPRYYLCLHNGYNHLGAHMVEFTEPMIAYSYVRGSEAWVSTEADQSSFDTMKLAWSNTSYTSTDENVNIRATTPVPLDSYTLVFGPTSIPSDADTFKYGNLTMYKVSEELLPSGVSHAIISTFGLTTSTILPATTIGNSQVFTYGEGAFVISVAENDLSTFGAPSPGLYFMNGILYLINCCAYKVEPGGGSTDPVYDVLSFQIGLALGLCGKGIPDNLVVIGGDDSGMYSYNGVILPPLPDYWDKNQFTHRLLVVDNSDDEPYYLLISSEHPMRVVNVDSDGLLEFDYNGLDTRTGNCVYIEDADLAASYGVEVGVWDGAGSGMVYGDQGTLERFYELVWADYDVKRSDGSVYLAKSEPKSVLKEVF